MVEKENKFEFWIQDFSQYESSSIQFSLQYSFS